MIQGIIQSEVKYLENDAIFLNHHTLTYHLSHTFDTLDKICNQSHNVQLHILKKYNKKNPNILKIPSISILVKNSYERFGFDITFIAKTLRAKLFSAKRISVWFFLKRFNTL